MGKAESILEQMRAGDAVYFVDADVFFYQHPYETMRMNNADLDLYVQTKQVVMGTRREATNMRE